MKYTTVSISDVEIKVGRHVAVAEVANMSDVENRCKYCAVREIFRCPVVKRVVEPGNEIYNCKFFKPKDRGMPREQKIRGSLGG